METFPVESQDTFAFIQSFEVILNVGHRDIRQQVCNISKLTFCRKSENYLMIFSVPYNQMAFCINMYDNVACFKSKKIKMIE